MTQHLPPDPLGPVVITSRDIYDALIRLQATVAELVSQGAGHRDDIVDHETRLRAIEDAQPGRRLGDLDQRVRAVEARLWPLPAAGLLLSLAALAVALLPHITA